MIAVSDRGAKYLFEIYNGNIKFTSSAYVYYNISEKEYIFSYAIAKFQDLVIFEE